MSRENEASIERLREVLKGDDGMHRVWGSDLRVLMNQHDEATTRAEVSEARLADLSGMTRAELVAREENKRINTHAALETCVTALKRVGCQDAGGCGMYEPDGLCFICAAIVKAEALR